MYAVLHPSNFFAQAAAHQRPELRKRAFVVLDGKPSTEMVFAANHAARSQGVEIGMTRLQAETFPEVVALRRVIEHEHTAHATLHHVACMFSPRIESVEERPGTYALDIRGMDLLYCNAAELANKLRRSVMTAGFLANIAVAEISTLRYRVHVAGLASRLCRPAARRTRSASSRSRRSTLHRSMKRPLRLGVFALVRSWPR